MARTKIRFKASDVTRALKGAQAAGIAFPRLEIEPDGRIVVVTEKIVPPAVVATDEPAPNPWDEALS
ncbi:hypothetical protein [Ancylobacter oerskovii]|uniref:Uncharacterized protein n=1 Tax=Ancylobacter oerskovii TaxID=459519 RepID=A0ABW4YVJ1_9HYPH|nr:hypothetical protein [Ancylobacter oerskovii]MBS7544370.1 hypothetical protein [Ancylobacter oerskovii]